MEMDALSTFTQFGVAGLIAWMWLTERRASAQRDRELSEAHQALREQRVQIDALMTLARDNTRAVASMESALRSLSGLVGPGARGEAGDGGAPSAESGERRGEV